MAARGPHNSAITWTPYYRVAWGGTLGSQGEIWTNSVKYVPNDNSVISTSMAASAGPGVWAAIANWVKQAPTAGSAISSQATLTWLKINQVNGAGLQPGETNYYAGAPQAGVAASPVPLYQTAALSLRSGLARGRAHIGRIFPPVVTVTVDQDGRMSTTLSTSMAAAFAACLQAMQLAIRTATTTVGGFAVCSPGNTVKGTVPTYALITKVEVDTVLDVQHRRTNKLKRALGTATVIAG